MGKGKKTRGARGLGTVFYSKRLRKWIARKTVNGRRVERRGPTQQEAIRRRDAALPPDPDTTTVGDWCAAWLESADVREQTRDVYRQSVSLRIVPQLGRAKLAAVTAWDVERAAAVWGTQVAANTVRKHLSHLRSMFSAARRAGLVSANPVTIARKPKATKVEIDPFTADELARIVEAAASDPKTHRLAVMAAIGCRVGEAIALLPGDYDAKSGKLSISRNRTVNHGVGPPKSANGVRTVRVPLPARGAATALGPELTHPTAGRRWAKLLDALGIRRRGPHQARHTCATLAIAAGVPIANVARDLGDHVQTIVSTYLHPVPGRDVCEAMEGLLLSGERPASSRP